MPLPYTFAARFALLRQPWMVGRNRLRFSHFGIQLRPRSKLSAEMKKSQSIEATFPEIRCTGASHM